MAKVQIRVVSAKSRVPDSAREWGEFREHHDAELSERALLATGLARQPTSLRIPHGEHGIRASSLLIFFFPDEAYAYSARDHLRGGRASTAAMAPAAGNARKTSTGVA